MSIVLTWVTWLILLLIIKKKIVFRGAYFTPFTPIDLLSAKRVKCEPKTKHLFLWNNINTFLIKAVKSILAPIVASEPLFCSWTMRKATI